MAKKGIVSTKEKMLRNEYFDKYRKWSKEERKTAPTYVEWKKSRGKAPSSKTYGQKPKKPFKTYATKQIEKVGPEVAAMSDVAKRRRKKK